MPFKNTLNQTINHSFLLCPLSLWVAMLIGSGMFAQTPAQSKGEQMTAGAHNFTSLSSPQLPNNIEFWREYNPDQYHDHPEFGILPENSPCDNCIELLHKRTINKRHFVAKNDTSNFFIQKANGDLHQLVNDRYVTINTDLKQIESGVFLSDFHLNPIQVRTTDQNTWMQTAEGMLAFNSWTLHINREGEQENEVHTANWSDYTAGDDGVFVHEVFPGIDATFKVLRGAVKTNFIVRSNEFGDFESLIFRDNLSLNGAPVYLSFVNETGVNNAVDEVEIHSQVQQPLAHISPAIAYPQTAEIRASHQLKYVIGTSQLGIAVPFDLIAQYDNQSPLVIDPLVTGTNTLAQAAINGSQYNATCAFTNSCNHFLTVPAPANATFTDVLWSFDYEAFGSCWMSDGALRMTSGGCITPGQVGFYWYCNLNSAGDCTGDNISVFDDLGPCLPDPSCNPQNVDFTLQFFRSCWGPAGCNNSCIAAMSPWTMTIQGFTVEPESPFSPISVSTATACEDEEITFSAAGNYGVPPYTYAWSLNPSGIPELGTGSNANLSFSDAGDYEVYVIVTDDCGNEYSNSIDVEIVEPPIPEITGDDFYCVGNSATLSTQAFSTYNWSNGGFGQSTTVTEADNPITVTVTNSTGCSGTSEPFNVEEQPGIEYEETISICDGESVFIHGNEESVAGVYEETFTTATCDSTATITLELNALPDASASTDNDEICEGDEATISASGGTDYMWDNGLGAGQSHTVSPAITTTYTVEVTDANGCSDTAEITVEVSGGSIEILHEPVICEGETHTLPDGTIVDETDTYVNQFETATGCDSVVTTELVVLPVYETDAVINLCEGETYTLPDGTTVDETGFYTADLQTAEGCDSILNFTITVNPAYSIETDAEICAAQFYTMPDGSEVNVSGTYDFDLNTDAGCDSIITINLVVQDVISIPIDDTICDNETYTLPDDNVVSDAGFYEVVLGTDGCDTLYQVELEVDPTYDISEEFTICSGESVLLPDGSTTGDSGDYEFDLTTDAGCDSIVSYTVEVLPVYESTTNSTICPGEEYTLADGTVVDQEGLYPQAFETTAGCDSIVNLELSFYPEYDLQQFWHVCAEDNPLDPYGDPITGDAEYFLEFTTTQGCDSLIHLQITYGEGSESTNDVAFCRGESYVTSGGQEVTQAGMYQEAFTNAAGCDSIVWYDVTVWPRPMVQFSASPLSGNFYEGPTRFSNETIDVDSIMWDFGSFGTFDIENPVIDYEDNPGKYEVCLYAWNEFGCSSSHCADYIVLEEHTLFIPNAFSPNEDGINDLFKVQGRNIDPDNFHLQIFNRYGELVFETRNPELAWNGSTPFDLHYATSEVFVYQIKTGWLNTLEVKEIQGTVTVLR